MIKIVQENEKYSLIFTPYNSNFVKEIKVLNAKWNPEKKAWRFPTEAIEAVRTICLRIFGETDIDNSEKVSIKVKVLHDLYGHTESVNLFGKTLSHAFGRDSGAKAGQDVYYLEGKPTSGGSAKNWVSIVPENSIILLKNVSKNLIEKIDEEISSKISFEVIEEKDEKTKLLERKEALLKELAEIEEKLKSLN